MKKKKIHGIHHIGIILGVVAGLIMILAGVLTAMKITPPIAAMGAEVALGIWRAFAGGLILFFSVYLIRNKIGGVVIILLGIFEIFVFVVEGDYSFLALGPFIAILAGILGVLKR